MSQAVGRRAPWWREATFGSVVGVAVVFSAALVGSRPLNDNSFLTHLATGRLILDDGRVPTVDPYSFTAPDAPWVVQSWLASVVYATAERLGGGLGLRVLYVALTVGLGLLLWRLTRPAEGLIVRLGLWGLALAVGTQLWTERPLLFGLVFFGAFLVAADREVPGPVVAVIGWLWVNTHGSFPLGIVVLGLLALGRRLDGDVPRLELKALRWATLGMVLSVVNPLGPKLLLFPIDLLQRQEVLSAVSEWRAPGFASGGERAFLLLLLAAGASLVRRPRWRAMLPMGAFTVAGLLATRNLAVASIVIVAAAAPGLAGVGSLKGDAALRHGRVLVVAMALLAGLVVADRLQDDHFELDQRYPLQALGLLEQRGVDLADARLVTHDVVGNLLTALYPHERVVYFDDRFDMYPAASMRSYVALLDGAPSWRDELEEAGADVVIWHRGAPLSQLLIGDQGWRVVALEDGWATFCRRESGLAELGC